MIRQIVILPIRMDPAGSGKFGAPRGTRAHQGIDYACQPGQIVLSPVDGIVTKWGYAYGDDLKWRIVDVLAADGLTHRVFYCNPVAQIGERVTRATAIGIAQDITKRYPGTEMLPHIHHQIEDADGQIVNPEALPINT